MVAGGARTCRARMIRGGSYLAPATDSVDLGEARMQSSTAAPDVGFRVVQELTGFYRGQDLEGSGGTTATPSIPGVEVMSLFDTLNVAAE